MDMNMDTCLEFEMQITQIIKDNLENRLSFDEELRKLEPYVDDLREIFKTNPELILEVFNELLLPLMV
jgi:hypothetical protein